MKSSQLCHQLCLLIAAACAFFASEIKAQPTEAAAQPSEQRFQLEYRDGTIISARFSKPELSWTDVSDLGQMTSKPIDVSRIKSLELTLEPASKQLSGVLNLIGQLDSEDFFVRERAEEELKSSGKRFRNVIERYDLLQTADGNYRLNRVLVSLRSKKKDSTGFALDVLTLNDGTRLTGDAGVEKLGLVFNEESVSIERKQISRIARAETLQSTRPATRETVQTKLYHSHHHFMQGREKKLRLVDFEHRPDGRALRRTDTDLTGQFVDYGLLLGTEYPKGCVGISGFEVVSGDNPVGGNSICVYKSKTRTRARFVGVMDIRFCKPGLRSIPHGVRDFGLFAGRVNHSRDLILEAYDAMGRLIGVCESNDEFTTFCGISSSIPIARIRVLSNPWLLEARKETIAARKLENPKKRYGAAKVDLDFAMDSFMFSNPVPVDSVRSDRHYLGRNGDSFTANFVRLFDADRIELGGRYVKRLSIPLADANTVAFKPAPGSLPAGQSGQSNWMAMLRDNSILQWNPKSMLRSPTLAVELKPEDVVAMWPARRSPQLPLAGDFDRGKHVLVFPGCRVATPQVRFDARGFRWEAGQMLTQPLHEADPRKVDQRSEEPDDVGPRKTAYSFNIENLPAFETPTIWFDQPTSMTASQGAIRLAGGEVLVYGKDALFELQSVDRKEWVLAFGSGTIRIPMSKIVSVTPPLQ